ncbi:hypothetical protein C8R43DRAFT_1141891 [Mycena crocata]|nr:hypothetical protein C8R43DRAFT_1141891 [Mycena crocata]
MPLPSSTTSLVAGGGDDLDDDDCLSFVLTEAASPSSSATSSTKSAPSTGSLGLDPDLAVSGSTDGLGALSASSVHLGALLGKLQCPDNMLANPDGALPIRERAHFHGAHLGALGSLYLRIHLLTALQQPPPLPALFLLITISPRSLRSTARLGSNRELDWFRSLCSLFEPYRRPRIHTDKPRAFRRSVDSASQKYSTAALSMPVGIIPGMLVPACKLISWTVPTYWIQLSQTGYSLGLQSPSQTSPTRFFCLELVSLDFKNQLILTFESVFFCFKPRNNFQLSESLTTFEPLLQLAAGYLLDLTDLALYDRDYRQLALVYFLTRRSSKPWSYIRSLFLRSDSPAVYSKAGILRRKTVTIFEMDYGPLIGLPSRSCSKLKAGSLFTSTQDCTSSPSSVFKGREYLHIDCNVGLGFELDTDSGYAVTIANPDTIVIQGQRLLKLSLTFELRLCSVLR